MATPKKSSKPEWYEELFTLWRPFFDKVSPRTTRAEVDAIIHYLGLKKGESFLDCPCGIGRISLPLAERGIRVTGVDITASYLEELETKMLLRDLPITLHKRDMRKITFKDQFDAAGNIWTSLGYFADDKDDREVLKRIYRALKPGGRFLLHVVNRDWIIRHFSPSGWEKTAGTRYFERRQFDFASSRNRSRLSFYGKGKRRELSMSIRMYSCHELIASLTKVGFSEIKCYGGYKREPLTMDDRMMWFVARKPRRSTR